MYIMSIKPSFDISSELSGISAFTVIVVFPNPVRSEFNVEIMSETRKDITIKLFDITGSSRQLLYQGKIENGSSRFNFSLNEKLTPGIYFIEIKDEIKRYFKKIIIE